MSAPPLNTISRQDSRLGNLGGWPEGKPISVPTVVDGGSIVVLVRGVVLGGGTLLALEGNAPPDIWRT